MTTMPQRSTAQPPLDCFGEAPYWLKVFRIIGVTAAGVIVLSVRVVAVVVAVATLLSFPIF